jgi:cytochrome P450
MTVEPNSIKIPAHVPRELVVDIDYFNVPGIEAGPHEPWIKIRDEAPPIFFTPRNGGHWIVTRASAAKEVLSDFKRFSSYPNAIPMSLLGGPYPQPPTGADPPEHAPFRKMMMPAFSPGAVNGLENSVRAQAIDLIEKLRRVGRCEFVGDFAQSMPINIFLKIVGLPDQDRKVLLKFAHQRVRGTTDAERLEGIRGLRDYAEAAVLNRRKAPRNDVLSNLANAEVNDRLISLDEARSMVTLILIAGLDTVVNAMALIARFLATHPGHRRQLIEQPQILPNAVEELIRRFAGPNIIRNSKIDQNFHGVHMLAGDQILSILPLAGLDEDQYGDPFNVDFNRQDIQHASFGWGVHRCIGLNLARMELRIFLQEWLARIPEFWLDPDEPWRAVGGSVLGMATLPLVFSPPD